MKKILCIILILTVLTGCSSKKEAPEEAIKNLESHAQQLANDLEGGILEYRSDDISLANFGAVVVKADRTFNVDYVKDFYDSAQNGEEAKLTAIFSESSFVVIRIAADKDYLYYLRFQHKSGSDNSALPISSSLIDNIELIETEAGGVEAYQLKLSYQKKETATFTFKKQ